jgi:chitin disaccharide deacetylase
VAADRYLIVNADDFGQSAGVNQGVITAHERGIVTSASLMVRWPAAREAAAYARQNPSLSVGLHLDLGELAFRDGAWVPVYEVVPADDADAVAAEVTRQLAAFRRLMGRPPTHLDSHQHVHRSEPARSVLARIARALGVPLRHFSPTVQYCGSFYGQTAGGLPFPEGISVDALLRALAFLRPGVTELGCHPGEEDNLETMYCRERAEEVRVLCDPRVRAVLAAEGIVLCSFHRFGTAA